MIDRKNLFVARHFRLLGFCVPLQNKSIKKLYNYLLKSWTKRRQPNWTM